VFTIGCGLALFAGGHAVAIAGEAAAPDSSTAFAHLQAAFELRFNYDVVEVVELSVHSRSGQIRRTLELAAKRIDGRLRSVGFFVEPEYLRGTKLLMIENFDRSDDFFLYLRSQKKIRRISTAQRRDSFMGTDLSYEDMEQRYAADFDVESRPDARVEDESVYVIHASPRYRSGYAWAEFFIAKSDHAILKVHYYREHDDEPWKIQRTPREGIVSMQGHLVPTILEMENTVLKSRTEVRFQRIRVNPPLEDSLFTTAALESGRKIPHLELVQRKLEAAHAPQ
jgi:hypothetical protein